MHKKITEASFHGLNWSSAEHDFKQLAEEYGRSVSYAAFKRWCKTHYPSSIDNGKRWHSAESVRGFLAEFANERTLFKRLLAIENARRKNKRTSMNAYDDDAPAKRKSGSKRSQSNGQHLAALQEEIELLDKLIELRERTKVAA